MPAAAPARTFVITPGLVAVALLFVVVIVWTQAQRWLARASDAKMLGNTPSEESACKGGRLCLSGPDLDERRRHKRTLVVAWRGGCLTPDYRAFLETLEDDHHDDLDVVAVALTVPEGNDPRAFGLPRDPLPDSWPPQGCPVRFEAVAPDRGYVADWVASPATYLVERDGALLAVWRGGMGPRQRERLVAWLEGRTWEEK